MTATTIAPPDSGELTASQAYQLGSVLHRSGDLQEAAAHYRRTLSIVPDHFGALCGIGMVSGQLGQLDKGLTALDQAARVARDSADAHTGIGMILAVFDRRREAVARFDCALAIDPDHVVARYHLANALYALDEPETAVNHYMKVLAVEPKHAAAHHNLGLALQRLGKWQQALAHHQRALLIKPDLAEAHASLGNAHRVLGRLDEARGHYQKAIAIRPDDAEVHIDLAGVLQEIGDHDAAVANYQRALAAKPDHVEAHYNLANILHELGRDSDAIHHYGEALRIRPGFFEAYNNLGNVLQKLGRFQEAVTSYRAATARQPGYAIAHHNLGNALLALNRHDEAIVEYEISLAIDPAKAVVHTDLAAAQLVMGNIQAAYDAYEEAILCEPANTLIHLNLASLKTFVAGDRRLAALQRLAENVAALPLNDQIALHFALGKAYGDLKLSERSFDHLLEGNRLKRSQIDYDEKTTLSEFDRVRNVFTPELMREQRGRGEPSATPVFIVGMPRSGTSLLEQILASHSRVFGAGELDDFTNAAMKNLAAAPGGPRQYPELISMVAPDALRRLGQAYVASVRALAPDAERIVDKMPANFVHVGLIHMALPHARIIHARRDPIDTCLSCFGLLFADEQPHTYDLAELGRYYHGYHRLMQHWREVLPEGVMLEVNYEDVVDDIEGQARRLIAHCGLAWEDRCLAFHETKRPVRTASVTQVRQPIYRKSVGRWLPYKDQLAPLFDTLELSQ